MLIGSQMTATEKYEWKQVPIGGGGYMCGISFHPKVKGLMYARGDVEGLSRRKPDEKAWVQVTHSFSPEQFDLWGVGGCSGIGLIADKPNIVYAALGAGWGKNGLYKSDDYGDSWTLLKQYYVSGNAKTGKNSRMCTQPIGVDPNNPQVIYVGTRRNGLLRSLDGGKTWDKDPYSDIPSGKDQDPGVRNVIIDPTEVLENPKRSKNIYLTVEGKGVYRSTDGGNSFAVFKSGIKHPQYLKLAKDGKLYLTHHTGVWRYDGQWTDITPDEDQFCGLALDPFNANNVLVVGKKFYRSKDQGKTWTAVEKNKMVTDMNVCDLREAWAGATNLDYNPHQPNQVLLCDAFGIYSCDDPFAETVKWTPLVEGLEGVVPCTITTPPEAAGVYPLYTGSSDGHNFAHKNPLNTRVKNADRLHINGKGQTKWVYMVTDIDFCQSQPNIMYLAAQLWNHKSLFIAKSTTGGKTKKEWIPVKVPFKMNHKTNPGGPQLAVSATDSNCVVVVPGKGAKNYPVQKPYVTYDGGQTWAEITDLPGYILTWPIAYEYDRPICSDRIDGNTFYVFKKGQLYVSTEKGKPGSWKKAFKFPGTRKPDKCFHIPLRLQPAPDKAGVVMVALGKNGLWISMDKGQTFQKKGGFQTVTNSCWGKPKPGTNISTAYVHAEKNGQWGIYRSTDWGDSWERITPDNMTFSRVRVMGGDNRQFGLVYLGIGGQGYVYGKPVK